MEALKYLKKNNPLYHDIEINDDWLDEWQETDPQLTNALIEGVNVNTKDETHRTSESPQLATNNLRPEINEIAHEFGFTIEDVPDNNDSLFLAILKQMALNGYLKLTVPQLRNQLADYMACYPDQYWPNDISKSHIAKIRWKRYLQNLREESHGDSIMMRANADMLHTRIELLEYNDSAEGMEGFFLQVDPTNENDDTFSEPVEDTFYLALVEDDHYVSLKPN